MPCGVFAGEPYLRRRQRRGRQLRSDAYEGGTACALYTHNLAYSKEGCYDLGNSHTAGIAHTAPRPVDSLLEGRCEVVDDDEEDVGLRGLRGSRKRGRQRSGEDKREHAYSRDHRSSIPSVFDFERAPIANLKPERREIPTFKKV